VLAIFDSDDELRKSEWLGELALAPRGFRLRSGFVIHDRTDSPKGRGRHVLRPFSLWVTRELRRQ
jgi:hypothetical protein